MEKYLVKIVIGLFIALALFGIINSFYQGKKEKLYTIGIVYEKSEPGKRGRTYYFKYKVEKKEFKGSTSGLNRFTTNRNGYIFLEVLKEDHAHFSVLEFNKVPDCITSENIPEVGWSEIPENPCGNEDK